MECQSDPIRPAPPSGQPAVRRRNQATASGSHSMDGVKSSLRTTSHQSNSRDLAESVFTARPAKKRLTTMAKPEGDRMVRVESPGSPADAGTQADIIRSGNRVTGPLADTTMTMQLPVTGGTFEADLNYVEGRPSTLRQTNGVMIDIRAKTVTYPRTGVRRFEDLPPEHYGLLLDILRSLHAQLPP
jgi:hypothetical protein